MKNILLVMDMQNGIVNTDEKKALAAKVIELDHKKLFDRVVCVKFVNRDDGVFPKYHRYYDMHKGKEIELIDELTADLVINRSVYSCVTEDFVEKITKINDGDSPIELFLCGIGTDTSILKSALDLFELDIKPLVLADYCIPYDGSAITHMKGIKFIEKMIGEKCIVHKKIETLEDLQGIACIK
ncbi:MAG: isochorismatase family protein [Clostridia bacterium]|nr:isochorismatase family protein [Clostridia bacterium]